MKAIDTNLLVRLIARDDRGQRDAARAVIAAGGVLLLPTVILETEWVLRSRYRLTREEIATGLTTLCAQDGLSVLSSAAIAKALADYAGGGDFADHLHLALAAEQGASAFITFDRSLGTAETPTRVEVIG